MALEPDSPVEDAEFLLRYIPSSQLVPGPSLRVQSEMFRHTRLSVDREALKPLSAFAREHAGKHVARFRAGDCRSVGYGARPDPLPENPAHGLVTAEGLSNNQLRRAARELRDRFVELIASPAEGDSAG
jgi:hypothetical protein